MSKLSPEFMTPRELAKRWRGSISIATLTSWRSRGGGPAFTKIGGRVLYALADVEAWEKRNRRAD